MWSSSNTKSNSLPVAAVRRRAVYVVVSFTARRREYEVFKSAANIDARTNSSPLHCFSSEMIRPTRTSSGLPVCGQDAGQGMPMHARVSICRKTSGRSRMNKCTEPAPLMICCETNLFLKEHLSFLSTRYKRKRYKSRGEGDGGGE